MQTRFVIVPAVPIEKESFRVGSRFYAATVCGGFDIYDNQAKERLKPSYPSRTAAQVQCEQLNKQAEVG
ncbi:hypothetical protein D3C76_629610 [compost metagenome]|jgi:hypothetical protein|uniref:Uncharacterized protein n=1 Tax=Pseudomonas putida S13.1.2 TaxID=1384061 RepID=A0AAU8S2P7_PSEPU|nr:MULTISPECIES: hypothetical protein [Pseudomonas]AJQ47342.1 hypothetical protein N805_08960 [Pseudomonas putida S13.1.2]MCS4064861.1 hypothetical protein [Pseudomonas putida]MDD1991186.1 hypothetical protein [Pseudomonas putida]TCP79880.1 hypothetical protein EC849_101591 [Pseudomonas putida]HDS0917226.1 hypothetical protein [Pseudomonas putida]